MEKLTKPAGDRFRQLQRIVNDIKKKKPGGIVEKFKKFQNDQVALICKSGKDTWDRITNKPAAPPSVPDRDYNTGPPSGEDDDWPDEFGSDYDSPVEHSDTETYEVPSDGEDEGENYEPPPNDNHVSHRPFKNVMAHNGYAEKQRPEPRSMPIRQPPRPHDPFPKNQHPLLPGTGRSPLPIASKPLPKPMPSPRHPPTPFNRMPASIPQQECEDEENYIVPESDNYIEPTKEPVRNPPRVDRKNKPSNPVRSPIMRPPETQDQELYIVPEDEPKRSPPKRGSNPKIMPPSHADQDEYEVCDDSAPPPEPPMKPKPSPSPRNVKPTPPNPGQKPGVTQRMVPVFPPRDVNINIVARPVAPRQRIQSAGTETSPMPPVGNRLPVPFPKPTPIQRPPETAPRPTSGPNRRISAVEQDADVLNKDWYVSTCDRRKAEDALTATSRDGSFLVRKSSGQDSKQPFTLVVFYNRRVYNIPVRYIEATRQYALGREKSGEEKFYSVAEIIENHKKTPLVLIDSQNNTKDSTKLKQAVRVP